MTATQSPVSISNISSPSVGIWLRGLLTVAWADGHFEPHEQSLILDLLDRQSAQPLLDATFQPITAAELGAELRYQPQLGENFMRMAVLVALADGVYSQIEDELLHEFAAALEVEAWALKALQLTLDGNHDSLYRMASEQIAERHHLLDPVRHWLDALEIHDPRVAHFLCKLIPPQCPFERDIKLFGHKLVHIPPMCKLNPLYDQLVGLRFRALSYLADDCQEDISAYC